METHKTLLRNLLCLLLCLSSVGSGVAGNSLKAKAVPPKAKETPAQQRARLLHIIQQQVGVVELTGRNDGAQVQRYLAEIGLKGNYAYCSATCVYCFRQAGYQVPPYGRAKSWFTEARTIYRQNASAPMPASLGHGQLRNRNQPTTPPRPTDLVGYWWSGGNGIGHVGFLVSTWGTGATVHTIEGNTFRAGYSREGNGVWENIRPKKMIYAIARATE